MAGSIIISDEVRTALDERRPVVAFETTILSFGLPHPINIEIALECQDRARHTGAVPATIGVLGGNIHVGLSLDEIHHFCTAPSEIIKVNLQNLSAAVSSGRWGALTVAATMQVCDFVGIRLFATGGIGGVHREFSTSLDISSDLTALARFPVCVVCSGAKSILDTAATLEALETLGIPVAGYKTESFPQFYCRTSPFTLDSNLESASAVADRLKVHWELGGRGFLLVAPVPLEAGLDEGRISNWIDGALRKARDLKITGKAVTPFLLQQLVEISGGATIKANRALILNNSQIASEVAAAL
jgi:pseudouridylate synthase